MTTVDRTERIARRKALMANLLEELGISRYGLFAVTSEGITMPEGSETASGFVLDATGQTYAFWLEWDDDKHRPAFSRFQPVRLETNWESDPEYQDARKAAGLN
jgi:hypothetical protein